MIEKQDDIYLQADGSTAYLYSVKAAVVTMSAETAKIFTEPDAKPVDIEIKDLKEPPKVVPWGERNNLPSLVLDKAGKLSQVTSDIWFNIVASYGAGIMPVRMVIQNNEKIFVPFTG